MNRPEEEEEESIELLVSKKGPDCVKRYVQKKKI